MQAERTAVKRLSFAERALQDLQEIHDYIARDNADAALHFIERLQERCNELAQFPATGRRREEVRSGYRSVTVGDYVIFYLCRSADAVEIVRVIHAKRDLGKSLKD
jgi:toxin ParE1/3/4